MTRSIRRPPTQREVIAELTTRFHRNGYVRSRNTERLNDAGASVYKKGYEVRLTAHSEEELLHIRELLEVLGFSIARPFAKGQHFRQPIYGREHVERFLSLVGYTDA